MIIIWWGKQLEKTELGFTSDFCFICRRLLPCRVFRLDLVPLVYSMPTGPGKFAGHLVRCTLCSFENGSEGPPPPTVPKEEELGKELEPAAARTYATMIDLERRRSEGSLSSEDRAMLLRGAFRTLAPLAESAAASPEMANPKKILFVGLSLFLIAPGLALAFGVPHPGYAKGPHPAWIGLPVAAVGVVLLGISVYHFATATRQNVREQVMPFLQRALAPLKPTMAELVEILKEWKMQRHPIGRYVDPCRLEQALRP